MALECKNNTGYPDLVIGEHYAEMNNFISSFYALVILEDGEYLKAPRHLFYQLTDDDF